MILGILLIAHDVGRFTARVNTILDTMNQVEPEICTARVDIRNRKDELDMLADHFNNMCEKLNLYINKSYLAEIEKKNAQMQALQSQINPHFLQHPGGYPYEGHMQRRSGSGQNALQHGNTFQKPAKETDIITLGQELDYCKQYLELFEYRYKGIFRCRSFL